MLLPLVVLATAATVIASQAVITGAYSLIAQAMQLGLLPRFEVRHTSAARHGQIYMPRVNDGAARPACCCWCWLFRTSSALASAYGIAVTTTMVADGIMGFVVIWKLWHWQRGTAAALVVPLVFVDSVFFSREPAEDCSKAPGCRWCSAPAMAIMIWTWRRGTAILIAQDAAHRSAARDADQEACKRSRRISCQGTAVFLTSDPDFVPTALLHNLKHNKVLHEHNVILTIETARHAARRSDDERVRMTQLSALYSPRSRLQFGFMESPNVPKALVIARKLGWQFDIMATSFFVSRRSLKPSAQSGMPQWQDHLFIALSRSANDATDYFQIPTGRVVEVGTQVTV